MSEKSGFEELMSQVDGFIFHPLTLGFVGFGVFCGLLVFAMNNAKTGKSNPLKFSDTVWLNYVYWFAILFAPILAIIFVSILAMLTKVGGQILTDDTTGLLGQDNLRWYVLAYVGLLTALGGVISTPLALIRVYTTERQTLTGEIQSKLAADAHFISIMKDATDDLNARHQTTQAKDDGGYVDIWQDDIMRRNDAMNRLERLAGEFVDEAPRIARLLSVYLREMTRDYPAEQMPEGLEADEIRKWANGLKVQRSDMETAAQVLGRLHELTQVPVEDLAIDLKGVNLQAMTLQNLNFEHATLNEAALDGAILTGSKFNRANLYYATLVGARLNFAELNGTRLNFASLTRAELNGAKLNGAKLFKTILHWANLSGVELKEAKLNETEINGANLKGVCLNGAKLSDITLSGQQLSEVEAKGVALRIIDFRETPDVEALVTSAFGDASVILPENIKPLIKDKWPDQELEDNDYNSEWELFKQDPDAYVPPQHR